MRPQRKDVTRPGKIVGAAPWRGKSSDCCCALTRRNTGGETLAHIHCNSKGGALSGAVLRRHEGKGELIGAIMWKRDADDPAGVTHHEGHRIPRHLFGRQYQIAFIFSGLIIDDDDKFALALRFDRFFNGREFHGVSSFPIGVKSRRRA
ncbi:hypothetical protein DSM21852_37070 [Methylocystis bryophila]|nr:hypothetical protein DSM21852_37070 [Methylocystis bryophila]